MDGLLIIDKPAGPTSHDVVARVRRAIGERRIGHTGTLDPMATGVLPLVLGRATRLARFLSGSAKSYEATIRFGLATDTADASGAALGPEHPGPLPSRDEVERALEAFRGTYQQQPPAFSAKKIEGRRSYVLARRARREASPAGAAAAFRATADPPALPAPVTVTVQRLEIIAWGGGTVAISLTGSPGFYVRALAHALGERLGVGAHLEALRRTASGDLDLSLAIPLEQAERDPAAARARIVPLDRMLAGLPAVRLTADGARRAAHGSDLGPADAEGPWLEGAGEVRLLDPAGRLVGVARGAHRPGFLHPSVVLS
ncbi:MAG: tRNA pseudouridine(55) synthase TruB [Betaproteobacteria bacterium]